MNIQIHSFVVNAEKRILWNFVDFLANPAFSRPWLPDDGRELPRQSLRLVQR
jgi:hypothetical protein